MFSNTLFSWLAYPLVTSTRLSIRSVRRLSWFSTCAQADLTSSRMDTIVLYPQPLRLAVHKNILIANSTFCGRVSVDIDCIGTFLPSVVADSKFRSSLLLCELFSTFEFLHLAQCITR